MLKLKTIISLCPGNICLASQIGINVQYFAQRLLLRVLSLPALKRWLSHEKLYIIATAKEIHMHSLKH